MDSILIFGGGDNQRKLIIGAKELGYRTIVIDPNKDAIGKSYADIFKVIKPKDYIRTKEVAEKYNVKGIVTCQMENPLLLMSQLAEEMRYRFPTVEAINKSRNKFLMKEAFQKYGVPCAKGILVSLITEAKKNTKIDYPAILKPLDAFSSRGVYKVNSIKDIEKYFLETINFSSSKNAIIEEFLEGSEYSVESVTNNGITYIIQITEKVITPFPNTVEMAQIQPADISEEDTIQIENIVKKSILALELDNCATHAELKLTSKGPKMIEVGARLGGDYITSHLVFYSTGINIEKLTVQVAMGDFKEIPKKENKGAIIKYLNLKPDRKVLKIGDWKKIFENDNLVHADINIKVGEKTKAITDSAKRAGFVIVKGVNKNTAIDNAESLLNKLEKYIKLV